MFECKLSVSVSAINAARVAAVAVNEALAADKHSDVKGALEAANKAVTAANNAIAAEVYAAILDTENPVRTAIEAGTIAGVRLAHDQKAGTYSVEEVARIISLSDIEARAKRRITAESGWSPAVGLVAWRIVAGVRSEVGASADSMARYTDALSKDTQVLGAGAGKVSVLSGKALREELQACLDKVIFEAREDGSNAYRVLSCDAKYFRECMTKEGKGINGLAVSHGSTVDRVLFKIAHRVVCNLKGYELEV